MTTEVIAWLLATGFALIELLAIGAALHAVMTTRTSQGAIAWSIALITFPFLTLPLYVVFGRNKFDGYIDARRTGDRALERIAPRLRLDEIRPICAPISAEEGHLEALQRLGEVPFLCGNDVQLLIDGAATFDSIFAGIERAESYVLVQFFIIRDDATGRALQQRLVDKLHQGVRVFLLYDAIGSHGLGTQYLEDLRQAGAEVRAFMSSAARVRRFQVNFRNHRKIVVVDGKQAWIGGHNVGDEYLGKHPTLSPWRDTHVQIAGPATLAAQLAFSEDWFWAAQQVLPDLRWQPHASAANQRVLVLPMGPADPLDSCELHFVQAIAAARSRVWIVSPYFVPDASVISALQLAVLRGVDVRVLLPDRPDHLLVYLAGFSYLRETVAAGVKLYRYAPGFLHQKVMLVDDGLAMVGTANLDNRSFRLNFEISAVVADRAFAGAVERMLERDFAQATPVGVEDYEQRAFPFRAAVRIARLLAPVL